MHVFEDYSLRNTGLKERGAIIDESLRDFIFIFIFYKLEI